MLIEDTPVKLPELQTRFGKEIAGLVDGVTKLTRLELQSDRTKQAGAYPQAGAGNPYRHPRAAGEARRPAAPPAVPRHFVQDPERRARIARETVEIYTPLAERIGMDAVKTEVADAGFCSARARGVRAPSRRSWKAQRSPERRHVIEEVRKELKRVCEESGVQVIEVSGREKSPYSIWEKMHRRNVAFEQLSDIMAFRIVVPSKEACYAALGAVHSSYPVIAGRFKDYISTPKSNGYQSLHTGVTLREPRNQKIEIQIRTADMSDVAENGVAAHWFYKEPGAPRPIGRDLQRFRWVQDLLEILEDSAAPDEFLENTKLELYADQVFCFTPKGQLIQLPRGATPVDFAYAVHSQVGDACVSAKINGRLLPLRRQLENGDQRSRS